MGSWPRHYSTVIPTARLHIRQIMVIPANAKLALLCIH